jgi:hypothetical protein
MGGEMSEASTLHQLIMADIRENNAPNEAIANTAAAINFFIFYSPVFVYLHHRLRFNLRQDYCDKIICITGGNK